jgi:hypothetical protein
MLPSPCSRLFRRDVLVHQSLVTSARTCRSQAVLEARTQSGGPPLWSRLPSRASRNIVWRPGIGEAACIQELRPDRELIELRDIELASALIRWKFVVPVGRDVLQRLAVHRER